MKKIVSDKYILKYDYYITKEGKVYSEKTKKFLSVSLDKDGYEKVRLSCIDGRHSFSVHRLVLQSFSPISESNEKQVNHKDGNKQNNNLENLEWCSCQENIHHAMITGLRRNTVGDNNNAPHSLYEKQVIEIIELLKSGNFTNKEIAKKYEVSVSAIERIREKRTWKWLTNNIIFPYRSTTNKSVVLNNEKRNTISGEDIVSSL